MPLSQDKKKQLLSKTFWDKHIDVNYALRLLKGEPERFQHDRANLYRRLMSTYDWYTILDLIPVDQLRDVALSEPVVGQLFPKELREKYRYARDVLSN